MDIQLLDMPQNGDTIISFQVEERERKDRKYISVKEEDSCTVLEINDYDLGVEPSWILSNNVLLIGFSFTVFIYDIINRVFSNTIKLNYPFFDFLKHNNQIIVVCESEFVFLNEKLSPKRVEELGDVLVGWSIKENLLIYILFEGTTKELLLD